MQGRRRTSPSYEASLKSYALGFAISIVLTLLAFAAVVYRATAARYIAVGIVALAIAQLVVQLLFFLHLGRESKPRWNLTVFLFAVLVVVILVFGSLWIMYNLDYRMMPPEEVEQYVQEEEAIHRD